MKETLAMIDAPKTDTDNGFNAGLVLWDDIVVEAAPIIGYMKRGRWSRDRVRNFCSGKGWTVTVVHELERARP